ncbi:MAG: phosphatidate cytidylyltransferase [Rhodospirillales bacterium]|nr:phosphatidate cytidylyltransferase [Rhodospirillales bacterium]
MTGDTVLSRFPDRAGSELGLRVLSGVVLATVSVALATLGGWWFAGCVLLLALAVTHEWFDLTGSAGKWASMASVFAAWLAMAYQGGLILALYVTVMGAAGTAMFTLMLRRGEGGLWGAAGTVYATVPLVALIWISQAEAGWQVILWLFFVVWATDSGAFAVGKLLKGPKLAPSISPGKTWSGAFGGLFGALVVGVVFDTFIQADAAQAAALAVAVSIAGQVGDLVQSGVKRRFGVKNTGSIIPGHGGVMDRLDSLVVASPVLAIVVSGIAFLSGGTHG